MWWRSSRRKARTRVASGRWRSWTPIPPSTLASRPRGRSGGARIGDPRECLAKHKAPLEGPEHHCDLVLPLQHLYVLDNRRTCREFDFPVILGVHDHHRVDETVEGTRPLKPGLDAVYATVLELCWRSPDAGARPDVRARFV